MKGEILVESTFSCRSKKSLAFSMNELTNVYERHKSDRGKDLQMLSTTQALRHDIGMLDLLVYSLYLEMSVG